MEADGMRDDLFRSNRRAFLGGAAGTLGTLALAHLQGEGRPSHAAAVMELGFDAVLLNTAVAQAGDPVRMARAFADGVAAGRAAYESTPMPERAAAQASTPTVGVPFWHAP
jgi:pyridoxal biosynthesis lyase PdxS